MPAAGGGGEGSGRRAARRGRQPGPGRGLSAGGTSAPHSSPAHTWAARCTRCRPSLKPAAAREGGRRRRGGRRERRLGARADGAAGIGSRPWLGLPGQLQGRQGRGGEQHVWPLRSGWRRLLGAAAGRSRLPGRKIGSTALPAGWQEAQALEGSLTRFSWARPDAPPQRCSPLISHCSIQRSGAERRRMGPVAPTPPCAP